MMRANRAPHNDNHGLTERLHDIRAQWSLQLDTITRAGPGAWLKKCIRQLDNTIFHTCDHEWEFYREPGPYGDRYEVCKRCGQAAFKRRDPIPAADLLPEIRRLLRSADGRCTEHLFHESAQARMTREALRSIAEDGNTAAVAACLSCNRRNKAYTAPPHPEGRQRPRKRPRNRTHGTPPRPDGGQDRPIETHTDRATQTEAGGLLCRDDIPDEGQTESAIEEVMDTLAGTATGYGCATFLPHDGPWTEDSQRWHEGSPICRSCENSTYPEACALLFSASTRTRSIAIYADQCQGCRGVYDGIRGIDDGYTQPEDIYSGHPLPLAASEWTKDSDIVPPLMEPGTTWERPSFKHGRLCFPDGRAAELAAAAALAASAMADAEVTKIQQVLNPQMHAAGVAAAVAAQAAANAVTIAVGAAHLPVLEQVAMNVASWASANALSAAADAQESWAMANATQADAPEHDTHGFPHTEERTLRMGRVIIETESQYSHADHTTTHPPRNPWLDEPRANAARQLMTARLRGLLQLIHTAKAQVDRVHAHSRPRAIPATVTRLLPGDTARQGNPLALTPFPWMDLEALLIERRIAHAAPTYSDYVHWISGRALCTNPIHGGATPSGELLAHYAEVAYMSASVAFHHNATTRSAWLGKPHALAFPLLVATPPPPLGLPLDQGPTPRVTSQGFYMRIDHLTGIPGRWAVLYNAFSNVEGCPLNATSLRDSLTDLAPSERPPVSEGSVYRTAHMLLQGLERRADWQQECPVTSCAKAAVSCPHAICPGLDCGIRRTPTPNGYANCGDPQCSTHGPRRARADAYNWNNDEITLKCFETLEPPQPFMDDIGPTLLDDEQWDLWCSGHPQALTHGASMQAMANELARLTPIEELFKREDTTSTCRTAHKRRLPPSTIRMNKRQRGPVSRRGSHTPVMMAKLTVVINGRHVETTAYIDTGADVSIFNTRYSAPCEQKNAPTTLRTVSGAIARLGKLRTMHIAVSPSKTIGIRGHAETKDTPLDSCTSLLGMPAIKALGIDLNALAFADNKAGPAALTFIKPTASPERDPSVITVFDLFCGIGGATIGMERAGWKTIGMIDTDRDCIEVCKAAFPQAAVYLNDCTTRSLGATLKQLKPDVVWSSPPCQPASSLNMYKKPQDHRAAAGVQACRHAIAANASLIIIENVLAYRNTPAYSHTIRLLHDGAYQVESNVINAAWCGLPQSRKRLIITGFRGTEPLGLREAIERLQRTPDATIKSLIPRADHIFFPPRLSRRQPYVISALDKCPCITTKCLGRPGKKLKTCAANSADISEATILTARDFAKLQGLPESHIPYGHQPTAGRLIGNAFPPICAENIAKAVTPALRRYISSKPYATAIEGDTQLAEVRMGCTPQWREWCHVRSILEHREHDPKIKTCRLSEKVLRQYLKKHGDDATASILKTYSIRDMDINPSVGDDVKQKAYKLCERYPDIWLKDSQQLPRPVLGQDGKPFIHKIVFKDNHKPTRCRQPEFPIGSAKRALLEAWTEQGLKSGLLVKAENSLWASRVLTVAKYNLDENRDGVPDNLRIVSDFVQANTQKKPVVPEFAHAHIEMHRVSGYRWYAQLDAAKGYWGFLLDEASSASTAIWLPHKGRTALFRYTRAVMGDQSAGATMNTRFAEALALNVDERARKHLSNMADDWVAFANTIEELLYTLNELFKMFDKFQITVNPAKVRLFYNTVTYWGFDFSAAGSRPSARNLNPVRQMQIPTTRKELQSTLGLFNFFSHYISDVDRTQNPPRFITYSELIAPMQLLVRDSLKTTKQFVNSWKAEQQQAFDRVKEILLSGVMLHAPDYSLPFRMSSDASDHGWGATLFQDKLTPENAPPDPEEPPGVPTASNINVIRMWSKAWTDSQRKLPCYFRESLGWCLGILKCRPYVLSSKFPLITQTDHLPLTWIKKSTGKAAISAFLTSQIADVDWRIYYLPGHLNALADAVSRPPFLGPLRPSTTGLHEMVKTLLNHLPTARQTCKHPWVYAARDTGRLSRQLQEWRTGKNPVKKFSCSPKNIEEHTWDMAIVVPVAENAGSVAHNLLLKGAPSACLLPSSLLHRVPQRLDGTFDQLVTKRVANAGKICFASGEYLWLIHDNAHPAVHRVYRATSVFQALTQTHRQARPLITSKTLLQPSATEIGIASTWSHETSKTELAAAKKQGLTILTNDSGQQYVTDTSDSSNRIIVPPDKRAALIDLTHKQSHHLGWSMNWAHLKPNYWWPSMKRDIKDRVQKCPLCKLAKGTRQIAHTHFRAKPSCAPRTAWSFDFKGMPESSNGSNEIAGAVDFATHKLILIALPNRNAQVAAEAIMEHICCREGTPLVFHSDNAAELMSRIMSHLWRLQGTKATQTLGHNPMGNSLVERVWRFVNAALRCLSDKQYKDWHKHLPSMAAAWNSTPRRTLGVSPFEASCGLPLRTPMLAIADKQPKRPRAMKKNEISMLHDAAAAFRKLASKNQEWNRQHEANLKNKKGRWKYIFQLGDIVKIFIPPTAKEAARRGRKAKHCFWYRGPAKIVRVLSRTTFTVQMCKDKRLYDRSIVNISRWGPADPKDLKPKLPHQPTKQTGPTAEVAPASTDVYDKGDIIAVKDAATDDTYWLADVTRVRGDDLTLAYYGTTGRKLQTATFRPMLATKKDELTFKKEKGAKRWTGLMPVHSLPGCVMGRKLKLTKGGKLSKPSFQVLTSLVNTLSHALADKPT